MKRSKLILTFLPLFIIAQNYDPETGEIIEESIDLNYHNFNDSYNNSTILQEYLPILRTPRYRLGSSVFSLSELKNELSTFPESKELLKRYHNMRKISFVGCGISFPMLFFGDNAPLLGIASFYGGLLFTIYAQNKAENILRKAIWVYNRENLKKNLLQ